MPAPLDLQLNGYRGLDFGADDLTPARLAGICRAYRADGGGRFLATVITDSLPALERRIGALADAIERDAEIRDTVAGIHVEGPFISAERGYVGAHPPQHASEATPNAMERLLAAGRGHVRMVTLAPERDPGFRTISLLAGRGMLVAAGHCDPSLEILREACAAGLSCFTHLGNGCPAEMHRHDNIIQRLLARDDLIACFIPDGIHLPPPVLRNLVRVKPEGKVILTTDAMSAAGAGAGRFNLGTLQLEVGADQVVRMPGSPYFAGSALQLDVGVSNAVQWLGLPESQVRAMASSIPAQALGFPVE